MFIRALSVLVAAATIFSVTGCAETPISATPTPVDYKACMVSSRAGFNDGGLNQDAYFGLLQSEAQFGVATSVVQLDYSADAYAVVRAGKKLVARGCNIVFANGDVHGQLASLANGNPKIQFFELDPRIATGEAQPTPNHNFRGIQFDYRVAYLQAGYLAAAKAASGKVAIIGAAGDPTVLSEIWYFRQGVYQYIEASGKQVAILGAPQAETSSWRLYSPSASAAQISTRTAQLIAAGADVILPIGVNGLAAAQVAQSAGKYVIGSDSDWATEDRYQSVKGALLASVKKNLTDVVVAAVITDLGASAVSPTGASVVPSATLTQEAGISYDGVGSALAKLQADYLSGSSTVVEPPATF